MHRRPRTQQIIRLLTTEPMSNRDRKVLRRTPTSWDEFQRSDINDRSWKSQRRQVAQWDRS